ncbi:MAG: hypothetical protein ABIJ56_12045 [Pseudomonadota bacterium]
MVDVLASKGYNNFKLNAYWDHFDHDGDGTLDVSLGQVTNAISHIRSLGLYASISVETYNVGGGGVPAPFFTAHPEAQAVNSDGSLVFDNEYGTGKAIPSIFHSAYLDASRSFIRNFISGLDHGQILYFETTVEPQYMGNQTLDYSDAARDTYQDWCTDGGHPFSWPPVPSDGQWNTFRAEALADWIEGDAAVMREVAGAGALLAVDYLETGGSDMRNRNGDSLLFLDALDGVDIIQCNWHWLPGSNSAFDTAYERANDRRAAKGWAISEHMTINGSDFLAADIPSVLQHTLDSGNRFGWEIVATINQSDNAFCVYNDDWSPKYPVVEIDTSLGCWLSRIAGGGCNEWDASVFGSHAPEYMVKGETTVAWIEYRNIGTSTWDAATSLGTQNPMDRASPFYTAGDWPSENRVTTGPATGAGPGRVHRFEFTLTAPSVDEPTLYSETFGLVQEGVTWIAPPAETVTFQITVHPYPLPDEELESPAEATDTIEIPDLPPDATSDPGVEDSADPGDMTSEEPFEIPDATSDMEEESPEESQGGCGCSLST